MPAVSLGEGRTLPPLLVESCRVLLLEEALHSLPLPSGALWGSTFPSADKTGFTGPRGTSAQLLSRIRLFATPWTAAHQASLCFTISRSLFKLMSSESVMPCNYLIPCRPLLLSPSIFPSIRVFSNESVIHIRWPKGWSFSFSRGTWEWPNPRRGLMRVQVPLSGESGGGPLLELCSDWRRKPRILLV